MTESNWTKEAEPEVRGTVTKTVPPAPPAVSDDKLKAGIQMLGRAAQAAHRGEDSKVEEVRRSLAPVLKEGAALIVVYQDLSAMFSERLSELITVARTRDLRRWHRLDGALTELDRLAHDATSLISSGLRVLSEHPRRVRGLTWDDVRTRRYEDIARDVAALRDGPTRVRGNIARCEDILANIANVTAKERPTRELIEASDPTYEPQRRQQTKADTAWDAFPGTPRGEGKPEPFAF